MQVSPMIERDDDGTVNVRMTEAQCSAVPFGSLHYDRHDSLFMMVRINSATIHWLASPEEARAWAKALIEVADRIRQPEAA